MSADKRSVSTDALETLGTIIGPSEGRDAIHLAVEPVTAVGKLFPGADVGFVDGGVGLCKNPVGIVDPFLKAPVQDGERFWLVVYPRQITSLRHVWSHPAFADADSAPSVPAVKVSELWMRAWAMQHMSYDYYGDDGEARRSEDDAFDSAIAAGHDNHIGPYEDARDYIDGEWWAHWEAITGQQGNREEYFSCSC